MLCQEKDQLHDAFSSNEGAYLRLISATMRILIFLFYHNYHHAVLKRKPKKGDFDRGLKFYHH